MRRELAHSLQRLLAPGTSKPPLGPRLSPNRDRLADARPELALLARRLLIAPSVDARGVARVRILLSDGAGPLLWSRSDDDLSSAVREAIGALESEADDQRRERKSP
jgi:hypothetical protein